MCYIFLDNGMIEHIKGSSIFLIGKPKITYEQVPLTGESSQSLTLGISFIKRMYESEHENYDSDDHITINETVNYSKHVSKSQILDR